MVFCISQNLMTGRICGSIIWHRHCVHLWFLLQKNAGETWRCLPWEIASTAFFFLRILLHGIHHHVSPPFGRMIVYVFFFSNHQFFANLRLDADDLRLDADVQQSVTWHPPTYVLRISTVFLWMFWTRYVSKSTASSKSPGCIWWFAFFVRYNVFTNYAYKEMYIRTYYIKYI